MTKKAIKYIQEELKKMGLDPGKIDGILGDKTLAALDKVPGMPLNFPKTRKGVWFIQDRAIKKEIETGKQDGYWGPQTEFAFESLVRISEGLEPEIWRPEDLDESNPNDWPVQKPETELTRVYGDVGKNQARLHLPYPHCLAWDTSTVVNSFSCHEKVHDSLSRVLTRVRDHYGEDRIKELRLDFWGGCLNVRQKRGGSSYSLHSWGIALDYDPGRNRLKWGRDKASFAHPDYDAWWRFWEEEGWLSLGRTRNFDWMHVQAAKI
ncbi:M15 family metallopeptidase [Desulfospira joergensenii]|uniref:M15 family metallopeptidase n=1 Tax=Desulfospira joergensenii TaxID=53329 RepID=UPI0004100DB8|nr:M15 family metallopeptidase [Desulfospira joergensenii]